MSDGDVMIVKLCTVRVCPIVMESSQRNRQPLALPRLPRIRWTSAYFLFLLFLVLHVIVLLQQQS